MPAPWSEQDGYRTLMDLVRMFDKERLRKPPFQRDKLLWDMPKRQSFLERTVSGVKSISVIVLYFLLDDPHTVYILDGLQRISTWWDWYKHPEYYGYGNNDIVSEMLEGNSYFIQVRGYSTHKEAAEEFQRLNSGLLLTPYEYHICHLAALDTWNVVEDVVDDLHTAMEHVYAACRVRSANAATPRGRRQAHHNLRHNLLLLYRFAYKDSQTLISLANESNGKALHLLPEYMIAQRIHDSGTAPLIDAGRAFNRFIKDTGAALIECYEDVINLNGDDPLLRKYRYSDTFFRFLIEARVIARVYENHTGLFMQFCKSVVDLWLYPKVDAKVPKSQIYLPSTGDISYFRKGTALETLALLERETNIDLHKQTRRRYDSAELPLAVGLVGDHDERPFADYGNGPTTPEVGSINSAKGKRSRKEYDADIAAQL